VSPPSQQRQVGVGFTGVLLASILLIDVVLLSVRNDMGLLTTYWSSVGLGVGLLAVSSIRRWPVLVPLLFALPFLAALAFGLSAHEGALISGSHVAQAVVAAAVLTRVERRRAQLGSITDLSWLFAAAVVGGLLSVLVETRVRVDDLPATVDLAVQVGVQHALSILLLVAAVLATRDGLGHQVRGRPILLAVQTSALIVALLVVFLPTDAAALGFAPVPIVVWASIAFDLRVVTWQLLGIATMVTLTTSAGRGPFADEVMRAEHIGSISLGYIACAALITLPLALIVSQREVLLNLAVSDEQLFRRTFTESPLGMVLMREQAGGLEITEVNAAAVQILGAPTIELEGRRFTDLVATLDHREHVFEALLSRDSDIWHGQASVLGRPGSRVDLAIAAIASADGSRVFSAQLLDQTQQHDSMRRLEAAHKLTDATLDTTACIIVVTDDNGTIIRVNAATKEITGYDEAALVGARIWETPLAALTRSETEAMFLWPNRSGFAMVRERQSYTAAGDPVRLVWNNNVVRDETGTPSYAVLTGVDVTAERSSTGLMAHLLQASIATALIGIDVTGRITVFNAGATHMLGYSAEEMIGQPFVGILEPSQLLVRTGAVGDREAFLCLIGMIGQRDESSARDWTWRTRSGHELIVSMTLSVTDDDVEDRVGFLCVGRDVTEQREGQETLVAALDKERTAVERLRALDRAKDEFVSTVSHELRTPVTSILGYTELLLDGDVVEPHPQQASMLETIARSSHRLIAICNDLLLLSGFEQREALANRETYDLREAIGVAEEFAKATVAQRPLTITFEAPDAPVMVSGDRSQLDRVFINLVSNAIKFTPDSGTVDIRLTNDDRLGAVITVGDTGIGIHRDDQDLVFQRFYRTDTAQSMAIPGTGLGLSIVAGIVDAHGGTIAVDSTPGEGTTFTVSLPVVA